MKPSLITKNFQITDRTTADTLDIYLTDLWKAKSKVHLLIDTTQCDISLRKVLSLKTVLNKHRCYSKQYVDHTTLLVKSRMVSSILKTALVILRPERPVHIEVASYSGC